MTISDDDLELLQNIIDAAAVAANKAELDDQDPAEHFGFIRQALTDASLIIDSNLPCPHCGDGFTEPTPPTPEETN